MKRALIAYFSASGVTAKVAAKLAEAVKGDLFEIIPSERYTNDDLNWMNKHSRSTLEMKDPSCRPAIKNAAEVGAYDVVFVGFPVWWYREPSIIDTSMESSDFSGKTIVPFCTSGSSGPGTASQNMAALCSGAKVESAKRFSARVSLDELAAWAVPFVK